MRSLPSSSGRCPASVSISVVLPAPFGPTSVTCSPRSSHSSALSSRSLSPAAGSRPPAPAPRDRCGRAFEPEAQRRAVARRALDPLHLVELLGARLRLARAGAGAEAGDEALEPLDLRLLALDGAPERQLARGLLLAPGVPGPGEVARAPRLELQHRGADRLEEPAVVGHEDHRRVDRSEPLLQPFERRDVQVVGGLVQQQQIGVPGERPRERGTGELAARERAERAVEVALVEPQPAHRGHRPLAPGVAAGVLEPGLGAGVAVERAGVRGAPAIPCSRSASSRSSASSRRSLRARSRAGQGALARRALVVQRDARALREDELAEVHRVSPASIRSSVVLPEPLRPDSVRRSRARP